MAIFNGRVKFRDDFNRTTGRKVTITTDTIANAVIAMDALIVVLLPLTKCGILKYTLSFDTDVATAIVANANLDSGLTMSYELGAEGSDKYGSQKWPAPTPALFDANGNLILTDPIVLAFDTVFSNGKYLISDKEVPAILSKGTLDS